MLLPDEHASPEFARAFARLCEQHNIVSETGRSGITDIEDLAVMEVSLATWDFRFLLAEHFLTHAPVASTALGSE